MSVVFGSIIARIDRRVEFQTDNAILGHDSEVRRNFFLSFFPIC